MIRFTAPMSTGILLALLLASPVYLHAADPRLVVKETPLGALPAEFDHSTLWVSPDGKRTFYCVSGADGKHPVIDNKKGGPMAEIDLHVSADGRRFAYIGKRAEGGYVLVLDDGKSHGPFDEIFGFEFSPDGSRWAGAWNREGKSYPVVDGRELEPIDNVGSIVFSPDFKRVFCIVRTNDEAHVVADGKPQKAYSSIFSINVSADGKHYVYAAETAADQWVLVVDGVETGKRWKGAYAPRLSADGSRVAFVTRVGMDENCAVIDGQEGKAYHRLRLLEPPMFSPDGRSYAYIATALDRSVRMVRDGREGKSYADVHTAIFSPDGRRLAYFVVARDEDSKKQRERLVIDEVEIGAEYYGLSTLTFSRDGAHVGSLASGETGWVPVLDGAEGNAYPHIVTAIHFDGPSAFHCFAVREEKLIRVDVALKKEEKPIRGE